MVYFKHWRFAIPLVLFFFVIIFLWQGLSLDPRNVPSPLINKPVPEFILPTLYDTQENMSQDDFIGHVTLFNVWATWCDACLLEHHVLQQLANTEDVIIFGLNYKDDSSYAKKWLSQHGNPYQMIAVDPKGQVGMNWGVYGTPETFVIDKKGVVRYKLIGPLTLKTWEETLKPIVIQLRNETL